MTTPTDSDLERLREEHQLDLTNVVDEKGLKEALRRTKGKPGSTKSPEHQELLRDQLVKESNSWLRLKDVKKEIESNIIDTIEEKETIPEISLVVNKAKKVPHISKEKIIRTAKIKKRRLKGEISRAVRLEYFQEIKDSVRASDISNLESLKSRIQSDERLEEKQINALTKLIEENINYLGGG